MKKVIIYTGPMCNYCLAAKHLLNKKKINYTEFDIAIDQSKMQEMQERTKGARTIPQIFIGETYVGGYNELKSLELQGKLQKFFKDNTLLSQPFVKDSSQTVEKYLGSFSADLTVNKFIRVSIG